MEEHGMPGRVRCALISNRFDWAITSHTLIRPFLSRVRVSPRRCPSSPFPQVHVSDTTFQRCRARFRWEKPQMTDVGENDGLSRTHFLVRVKTEAEIKSSQGGIPSISGARRRRTLQ